MAVEKDGRNGLFWLTASQKLELMTGLTESLAESGHRGSDGLVASGAARPRIGIAAVRAHV